MKRIDVIGMGPGNEELLPAAYRLRMQTAQRVFNTRQIPISTLLGHLGEPFEGHTVVLVSGDTGFHSLAQTIEKRFGQSHEVVFHPGVGSISCLSAKLKIPYDDAELISLHGNHTLLVPRVSYCNKVFALTGGTQTAADCCRSLTAAGLGDVKVAIGESLTLPEERILMGKARDFVAEQGVDLAVLYVENPNWVSPHRMLKDSEFIRGEVPMTKEEVRHLSIGKLEINPEDLVYDVGAGTGSVSVELARKAFRGMVYAIEKKPEALHLMEANRLKHGAFNLEVVEGTKPCRWVRITLIPPVIVKSSNLMPWSANQSIASALCSVKNFNSAWLFIPPPPLRVSP